MTLIIASAPLRSLGLIALMLIGSLLGTRSTQAAAGGIVVAWGYNSFGQTSVPVAAQSGVTAIAAGYAHSVALQEGGTVVTWGSNEYGQVTGERISRAHSAIASPVTLQGQVLAGVTAIAAGAYHTVALKNDGTVVAWGWNSTGQVTGGPGNEEVAIANPVTRGGQVLSGVRAIAAGYGYTVALKNDGSVVTWGAYNGSGAYGAINLPVGLTGVTAIAAGARHTAALKNDGSVVVWGAGRESSQVTTVPSAAESGVAAIAAGSEWTVALKSDGSLVAWGLTETTIPVEAKSGVRAIAASGDHNVALKNDGSMVAWGENLSGQTTVPAGLRAATAIAAGYGYTLALVVGPTAPTIQTPPKSQEVALWQSASFTVKAAGAPLNYQWRKDGRDIPGATEPTYRLNHVVTNLSGGTYTVVVSNALESLTSSPPAVLTVNPPSPGAVVMFGLSHSVPTIEQSGVTAIASSSIYEVPYFAALKSDGSIVAWGINEFSISSQGYAETILQQNLTEMTSIAGGIMHMAALKRNGTVAVWGYDGFGTVTGTPSEDLVVSENPLILGGQVLSGVAAIATGSFHTVALKNDGTVVAWGDNHNGQVTGIPSTADPTCAIANPVTLDGQVLNGVKSVAPGRSHTVVLKNDGTVAAWGSNGNGEVTGVPSIKEPYSAVANPVRLGGEILKDVTAIAVADANGLCGGECGYTVALKSDGSVVAWGYNDEGETMVPKDLAEVTAIAAGHGRTMALKQDGTVVVWGYNGNGEVTGSPSGNSFSPALANPVTLGGQILSGVTAVAIGPEYTLALKNNGTLAAWGDNSKGQVTGTPSTVPPFSAIANPVTLEGQVLSDITAIYAAGTFTMAIVDNAVTLQARISDDKLTLSWPANISGFTLQSTSSLTPSGAWINSTVVPIAVDGRSTVTTKLSGRAQFFRLRKP